MWFDLPDMTIQNVIDILGFQYNKIMTSSDVLHVKVSCAPTNIITIVNRNVCNVDKYDHRIKSKGCIQNIMHKIETFILH